MHDDAEDGIRSLPADRPAWYVVRTKRHREQLAHARLGQRGLVSYVPMIVEWPRPVVGSEIQPLFPGYLFVRSLLPRDFYLVAWCEGVQAFVMVGGAPASLPDGMIELLRAREGPDGLIRPRPAPPEQTLVRISDGPFRGVTAMLERRIPARHRVRVLLQILQRATPVEVPERWVRRA